MSTALLDPLADTDWDVLPDWWHAANAMAPPTLDEYAKALEILRAQERSSEALAVHRTSFASPSRERVIVVGGAVTSDLDACPYGASDMGPVVLSSAREWAPSAVLRVEVYDAVKELWIDVGLTFRSRAEAGRALDVCRKRKPSFRFRVTG